MRLSSYLVLMFSIASIMYLMGYGPVMGPFKNHNMSFDTISKWVGTSIFTPSPDGLLLVGLGAALVLGALAGFSSLYLIPIIILSIIALNVWILPLDFLLMLGSPLYEMSVGLFNLLQILAILNFVRGGA